jgi:hypothetical protein
MGQKEEAKIALEKCLELLPSCKEAKEHYKAVV